MSAGTRSFLAFWIGGAASGVVVPPPQNIVIGGGSHRPRPQRTPRPSVVHAIAPGALIVIHAGFTPGALSISSMAGGMQAAIGADFLPGSTGGRATFIPGKATGEIFGLSKEELFLLLEAV